MSQTTKKGHLKPRHAAIALCAILVVGLWSFDWDWLRPTVERYVSEKTERTLRIGHLDVKLGVTPTIRLHDVWYANATWSDQGPMARVKALEVAVSLRDLLGGKILLPRVTLDGAQIMLHQRADGRANWLFSEPSDTSSSAFRIGSLSVTDGRLRFIDDTTALRIDVQASPLAPASASVAASAEASADGRSADDAYQTRFQFSGEFQGSKFDGSAVTGGVISFEESGIFFPIKGELNAATTRATVQGRIADAATLSGIDVQLKLSGQTLANLYPFLLLPLPATPPYSLSGHLKFEGKHYVMDRLDARIGATDLRGGAVYTPRSPRPLLEVDLDSNQLVVSDLGPLIGVETKASSGKPNVGQAQTADRPTAQAVERQSSGGRVLPAGRFDPAKLTAIDARLALRAAQLKVTRDLPLESLTIRMDLTDGLLRLDPLRFGIAGGQAASRITMDARQDVLKTDLSADIEGVRIARLMKTDSALAKGAGTIKGRIELRGSGNSVADAAAHANGVVYGAVGPGRLSNLLDAASTLNGGKVIPLLVGGDKEITLRCGVASFDVRNGRGVANTFVVDTEQTQITGEGGFNLDKETFNLKLTPLPKSPGILSLRTPVHVAGTFRQPDYQLEKQPLLLRLGAAAVLATVAPPAALLALLENGPGEDSDCAKIGRGRAVESARKDQPDASAAVVAAGAQRASQ